MPRSADCRPPLIAAGKASVPVPDLPWSDLRVRGGWDIPVLLRFRS